MFKVIDVTTGIEPTEQALSDMARQGGLIETDIDCFALTEDDHLILLDSCGHVMYCDMERFRVETQ